MVGADALAEHGFDQIGGDDGIADHGVVEVGPDGGTGVRQQRPRRGRPDQQRQAGEGGQAQRRPEPLGGIAVIGEREPDIGRLVDHVPVDIGLAELVAAQRRPTARAVGHHLDVLVEEALVPDGLEVRPHRLHELGREGPVGVVDVEPVPDPLGEGLPFVDVVAHRLPAQPGELGDAHLFLDLALGGDAQLLLHLDLDRQAVGVPAGLPGDGVPPHGPVAAEQVLVGPGPDVMEPGAPVGSRRALVKHPGLGAVPQFHRPLEDAVLLPSGQLFGLEGGEIGVGGDRAEQQELPLGGDGHGRGTDTKGA